MSFEGFRQVDAEEFYNWIGSLHGAQAEAMLIREPPIVVYKLHGRRIGIREDGWKPGGSTYWLREPYDTVKIDYLNLWKTVEGFTLDGQKDVWKGMSFIAKVDGVFVEASVTEVVRGPDGLCVNAYITKILDDEQR